MPVLSDQTTDLSTEDLPGGGDQKRFILVVGAGVIGLTTAIRLREAGHEVSILAAETPSTIISRETSSLRSVPPRTYTSAGSGGLWMPFILAGDIEAWATAAFEVFKSESELGVGVDMLDGFLLQASDKPTELPWYAKLTNMKVTTHAEDKRVPDEYQSALQFTTPIVQMEPYLTYLEEKVAALGIPLEVTADHVSEGEPTMWTASQVADFVLQKFESSRPLVVNCCGLGARLLAGDEMIPGRGVIVRVRRPVDKRFFITEDMNNGLLSRDGLLAYCIPRGEEYTLGGTIFKGDWRESVSDVEVTALLERVEHLLPGIAKAEQTGVWAGLRPLRADGSARVEIQEEGLDGKDSIDVIANYGHGGSGVTICWGCADEVVKIVAGLRAAEPPSGSLPCDG